MARPCKKAADTSPFPSRGPSDAAACRNTCRESRVAVGLEVVWVVSSGSWNPRRTKRASPRFPSS
eukprot:2139137-Lingulodinium_polyedra.AAC.1